MAHNVYMARGSYYGGKSSAGGPPMTAERLAHIKRISADLDAARSAACQTPHTGADSGARRVDRQAVDGFLGWECNECHVRYEA